MKSLNYLTLSNFWNYGSAELKDTSENEVNRPIIGIGRLSAILPIIGIGRLLCWYRPIVVCTIGRMLNEVQTFEASVFNSELDFHQLETGFT